MSNLRNMFFFLAQLFKKIKWKRLVYEQKRYQSPTLKAAMLWLNVFGRVHAHSHNRV